MKLLPFLFLMCVRVLAQSDSLYFLPATNVLYRDCMNILRLQNENLNFSLLRVVCDSCEWKKNSLHPEKIGLVPHLKAKHAKITLYEGEKWIGEKVFNIIDPPKPEEEWTISGQNPYKKSINKGARITYTLIIDNSYAKQCPLDAHYRINSMEFYLQFEGNPPINVGKIDCSEQAAEKGVTIYIPEKAFEHRNARLFQEAGAIYRLNYLGYWVEDTRFVVYCNRKPPILIK